MYTRVLVLLWFWVLPGCAVTPARRSPAAAPAPAEAQEQTWLLYRDLPEQDKPGAVELSARIDVLQGGGARRPLRPHETLRSGDRFAVTVSVAKPAYVYVVHKSRRAPAILFPGVGEGEQMLAPGRAVSLPSDGEFFELDQDTGEENIYVVAAPQPLLQADPELCQRLGLVLAASGHHQPLDSQGPAPSPPPPPEQPPPDPAPGDKREPPGDGQTHMHRGVALARFVFQHAPRR